jgi:hypothetical protein
VSKTQGGWRLALWTLVAVVGAGLMGCGGQPTSPPPPPSPVTGPHQVTGVVVSNQTRTPIAGAVLTLTAIGGPAASTTVSTGPGGEFSFPSVPDDRMWLSISAAGHLDRVTYLQVTDPRQGVAVDLISTAPPFSLDFYRQFARRGFEQPANLTHLHPWSIDPSFYLRTVVEDTGESVSPLIVEGLKRVFTNAVPELSAGLRRVAAFETGSEARPGQPGWVNVTFVRGLSASEATVGPSQGAWMKIRYDPARDERPLFTDCESGMVEAADHEIVHTMGYLHTHEVANDFRSKGCTGAGRPDRVGYHAAIMYSRAYGNRDPDRDHFSFLIPAEASQAAPVVVSCPARFFR